jgi:hypothetical protein
MEAQDDSNPSYELREYIINGRKVVALFPKEANVKIFMLVRDMLMDSYVVNDMISV